MYIQNFIASLLLPPGIFVIVLLFALLIVRKSPRFGYSVIVVNALAMLLLSMPIVASHLMNVVETHPPLHGNLQVNPKPQAIVILAGGRHTQAPEYNIETVNAATLTRIRYGAKLHRLTQLPILVTGGNSDVAGYAEGELMAGVLRDEFKLPVKWIERNSRNTAENAKLSRQILEKQNITHIYLVTHAWHMPRAYDQFSAAGFVVTPAPTGFNGFKGGYSITDFFPSTSGLRDSHHVLHELLGQVWYALRYP